MLIVSKLVSKLVWGILYSNLPHTSFVLPKKVLKGNSVFDYEVYKEKNSPK